MECEGNGNHRASVGATEIEKQRAENGRKHAYYEALLATENTRIHNEPVDDQEIKERPEWPKWEAAMQEQLNSPSRNGTYEQGMELLQAEEQSDTNGFSD